MKLVFIGADHEVTGSCHYMEVGDKKFCVDIGMEQGQDLFENQEIPVNPSEIDFILLTHAHIDHTGLLPMLFARGFRGQVYATKATVDLSQIMLRDSAHIQQFEAEWRNRKARRSGGEIYEPLYTMEDALGAIRLLVPCEYDKKVTICDEVTIRFTDVGHLLGSSSIEVFAKEGEEERTVVFSGDLGNTHKPILRDPIYTKAADYVVMESTYGDRLHGEEAPDYVGELAAIIESTFRRGGNVVVPSFAVGRTQEILYFLRQIKEQQLVKTHPDFEVYVDNILTSPRWFTAYHGEGDRAEPTDEERQELIDRCVDAKLYDAMHTMDEALDGQGAQTVIFSLPLVLSDDVRMSSTFAQNRTGVDLAAPEGTTVLAAADGTVTEYDYNEDDGYCLVLYHSMDDGTSWQTRYSHLGSVKVQVDEVPSTGRPRSMTDSRIEAILTSACRLA